MKIRLAVIFGGESVEHEISIISAQQAMESFDREKYEIIPVYISKENNWYTGSVLENIEHFKDLDFIVKNAKKVQLVADKSRYFLYEYPFKFLGNKPIAEFDVAFPIVHGTNVEDGTLQGLLQMNKIPYAGPNVSGAAVGQDKVLMKLIWQASNLPVLPYVWCYSKQWESMKKEYLKKLEEELGYPMIIKPASLGSSVGISIAKDEKSLEEAMDTAAQYDDKIIVEKALTDFIEINCSVLGTGVEAKTSALEKVFGGTEFLSYQDKYQGGANNKTGSKGNAKAGNAVSMPKVALGGSKTSAGMASTNREIPAQVSKEMEEAIKGLAELGFKTLGMSGVSRIDFLVDTKANKVYLNEINTIPGSLSFYLWQATGVSFSQLLDELVTIAIENFRGREKQIFSYESNVLSQQPATGKAKGGAIKM